MSNYLEEGNAIEIIDGDIDILEKDSLKKVMYFVKEA